MIIHISRKRVASCIIEISAQALGDLGESILIRTLLAQYFRSQKLNVSISLMAAHEVVDNGQCFFRIAAPKKTFSKAPDIVRVIGIMNKAGCKTNQCLPVLVPIEAIVTVFGNRLVRRR